MELKILTLNLWAYFDWENREDSLIKTLRNESPDIIALQEVQLNTHFSNTSQVKDIAKKLNYNYFVYSPIWGRTDYMEYDKNLSSRLSHGLGLISKYPIVSTETYLLLQQPDHDEPYGVNFVRLDINGIVKTFCNVHFGNSDRYSKLHLQELVQLCKNRNIAPILLGDFNNFNLELLKNNLLRDYTVSTEIAKYVSMPKNNGTLDYIVTPKDITIEKISCLNEYLSDHRALIAQIKI